MHYCSSIPLYDLKTASFTAIALLTTAQFIEARRANYAGFQQAHIHEAATAILQNQFFLLVHWTLCYHKLSGPFSSKIHRYLHPRNFIPSHEDISTYIAAPRFLWRFSKHNFIALTDFLKDIPIKKKFRIPVVPYTADTSLQLEYLIVKRSSVSITIPHPLHDFHSVEYTYSLDFHLHKMKGDTTYQEFVLILLTGVCPRYRCGLYKLTLKSPSLENRHYNVSKLLILVKRNSYKTIIRNQWHISTDWTHTVLLDTNIFPLNFYSFVYKALGDISHIEKHPFKNHNKRLGWTITYLQNEYIDVVPLLFWRPFISPYLLTKHDRRLINRCETYFSKLIKSFNTISSLKSSQLITSHCYPYPHPYLDETKLLNIPEFHEWLSENGFSTGVLTQYKNDTFRYMSEYKHLFKNTVEEC